MSASCSPPVTRRGAGAPAARAASPTSSNASELTVRAIGPVVGHCRAAGRSRRGGGSRSPGSGVSTSTSSGDQPRPSTRSATSSTIVVVLPVPGAPSTAADAPVGQLDHGALATDRARRASAPRVCSRRNPAIVTASTVAACADRRPSVETGSRRAALSYASALVDIRIGIANSPREISFESAQTAGRGGEDRRGSARVRRQVRQARRRQGQALPRADRDALAYLEVGSEESRRVGFVA